MSLADTALSLLIKMAPGPGHRQEPVAPDKNTESNAIDITTSFHPEGSIINPENGNASNSNIDISLESVGEQATSDLLNQTALLNSNSETKQEEPATLSTLNEGELRALLDEAITYKNPKDREGKSSLFKELLQEAEADETEEGRRILASSRGFAGSNRRRHKRDSVSERLTHGGSLQNLTQPIASEFDSSFGYLTSGCSQTYGGSKRKNKKYTGSNVSARQREGGSLPSNVNASHNLASLTNFDLLFEKKKNFCEERSTYDWTSKEKSKSLDKQITTLSKKDDKKEKRESKKEKDIVSNFYETETEIREKKNNKVKYGANEMLESDNTSLEDKSDYMLINLNDIEVGVVSERNVSSSISGVSRPHFLDTEDDEGTEMKIIEPRRSAKQITRTAYDIQTPVDTTIEFPIQDHNGKQDKSKITVSNADLTTALPFQTSNMKCVISAPNSSNAAQAKLVPNLYPMIPSSWPTQNITMEGSRYSTQQIALKDATSSGDKKSLDENGNAVQGYNGERKKIVKKKKETNVIVYKAQDVKGHHYEQDIENQINFIENKDSKGKKNKSNNSVRVKPNSGAKPRAKGKDSKREQLSTKLQKSNSLEEISKTKLEDLMAEKSVSSSGASSISSQQGTINVALRRTKQRNARETTIDSRGDRRSWGTEEGQSIYCNDIGDEYTSRRNVNKKSNPDLDAEHEFLVVTKKKKSKKQQRSSSGSRAQNLTTSAAYLQHTRGFSNEYSNSLSPELRRKSASSMPPSDKSDSSDLDSVHSLPVTSNTSKHNLSKTPNSSEGTPQASYADIARMATINIAHTTDLSMSTVGSTILNPASWPSVQNKTPSEPDKLTQDCYPSLDELQQDKKIKQFSHSNNMHNLAFNFDKLPSSTLPKIKHSSERSKAEAQEEAINKNIQVFKYVQDIEKMHQTRSQQQKQRSDFITTNTIHSGSSSSSSSSSSNGGNSSTTITSTTGGGSSNNSNNNTVNSNNINTNSVLNEQITIQNRSTTKTNNTIIDYNSLDNCNSPVDDTVNNVGKESNSNVKYNNTRSRRNYFQSNQNVQSSLHNDDQALKKYGVSSQEGGNKKQNNSETIYSLSCDKKNSISNEVHNDSKIYKMKYSNANKLQGKEDDNSYVMDTVKIGKTELQRMKAVKEPQCNFNKKQQEVKTTNYHVQNPKSDYETIVENKNARLHQTVEIPEKEAPPFKAVTSQTSSCKGYASSRPAVILLDESTSDISKSNDLPMELTFGFEINEQLLLSEDSEENSNSDIPIFPPANVSPLEKRTPSFDRSTAFYNKHMRYDKYSTNLHHMQSPNSHLSQTYPVHTVMMQSLPYVNYSPRYQTQRTYLQQTISSPPPPPLPPPAPPLPMSSISTTAITITNTATTSSSSSPSSVNQVIEKCQPQSREDFSMRFVAPEETVNLQNYNHDKIVTFVGAAWDAVMREMPGTETGRIQYYSGQ